MTPSAGTTGGVELTQLAMVMGKADQIASLALTGNKQLSLAHAQNHASHSVDESKSNTCG